MTSQALNEIPQMNPIDMGFAVKNSALLQQRTNPINIPSTSINILSPMHPTTPTMRSQGAKTVNVQMPFMPPPLSVHPQSPKQSPAIVPSVVEREKYTQKHAQTQTQTQTLTQAQTQTYLPETQPQIKHVNISETMSGMHTTQRVDVNTTQQTRTVNMPETQIQFTQPPIQVQPKYKYLDQHGRPLTDEEVRVYEAKILANYNVKFSILRDNYPNMKIPEIANGTSIPIVEEMYNEYVKKIHIDSSVETNKIYLLMFWLVIEIGCSKFFNLPIAGYTQNQIGYMNKYQMLLIELGENSYQGQSQSTTPIEIRLLIMAVFNAVIFIGVKILSDKISPEFAESLRESISSILMPNKVNEVLHRAEQATADNIPPPMPEAKAPMQDMGGMGNILAQLASMFAAGSGPKAEPQVKKPTTVGGRKRQEGTV